MSKHRELFERMRHNQKYICFEESVERALLMTTSTVDEYMKLPYTAGAATHTLYRPPDRQFAQIAEQPAIASKGDPP